MMRSVLLFAFLSLMPAFLFGQSTVTGVVLDSLTQEPLPSATVYINGTTQGTTTDNDGRFELKGVSFPATIVFSFVGYQPKAMDLDRNPGRLTIGLRTNDALPEVVVSGKKDKLDKVNLEYFKTMFLGDDRWGLRAEIENENVLMFDNSSQTTYYTRKISRTSFATPYASNEKVVRHVEEVDTVKVITKVFTAWAHEPLIIDLPLLGYELYVDLVKFTVLHINSVTTCNILGYFYYKPYEKLKKRQTERIEENRKKAYYGSSQHFLRSIAQNSLAENGYILTVPETIGKKRVKIQVPVDINEYSKKTDKFMQISGLKDKELKIRYYHRSDGSPMNFKAKGDGIHIYSESGITFLEDSCIFLKEGVTIDNNVQFTGDISKKRIGASLPGDYLPPVDSSKINVADPVDYTSELIKFADNIHQFNRIFPQEKVYLEFDNTAYFQGEDIWYKAFVTNASTLEQAPSGVLYVDFLSPTGKLLLQQKLKIVSGQADGIIPLLNAGTQQTREKQGILAYPSGFYEIRAYTQNMLDFSPEAIFSRVIPVYTQPKYVGEYDRSLVVRVQDNPLIEDLRGEPKEKYRNINVTFYPEGGDLVRGLPCRVAFKATGSDGFGLKGALKILNQWDSVRTVHDGMGTFIIDPRGYEETEFYPYGSDEKRKVRLPEAKTSGYSMISDMLSDSLLQVNIWRTQDRLGEQTALAVTCRGEVIYFEEIKDIESSQLNIDCSAWPVGVCRITLYNKDGNILSSRSIFHGNDMYQSPTITANTDSMSHQSCDKEVIEFNLTDQDGNPLRDRFCLSVRDATDYGGGQTDNLQTNLLLSSDLKGYIHDPAWYLESNDSIHREALNLLTLVQGWERYEWQTMTGQKEFKEKHRIEEGLTMNGWILSYGRRQPVSDISIYAALIPDDDKTLFESYDYQTDSTGYFGFDLNDFYGKGDFTIHVMATKKNGESKYKTGKRIRFERADRPDPRPFFKQETDLKHNTNRVEDYKVDYTDYNLTPAQRRKLGKMITDVDIEEESGKIRFVDYDTFASFEAEEEAEFELDQGEYTTTVGEYFREQGIQFGDEIMPDEPIFGDLIIKWITPCWYIHNNEKVLRHKPFDIPLQIDMIDVKSIIIYDRPMTESEMRELTPLNYKTAAGNWSSSWNTNSDINGTADEDFNIPMQSYSSENLGEPTTEDMDAAVLQNGKSTEYLGRQRLIDIQIKEDRELLFYHEIYNLGRRSTTVKGFTKTIQFYAPEYPDGPIEGNVDARRTLYWNPNVITDNEGQARVEFYNNSFTRRFTINASGITASGIPYVLNQNW